MAINDFGVYLEAEKIQKTVKTPDLHDFPEFWEFFWFFFQKQQDEENHWNLSFRTDSDGQYSSGPLRSCTPHCGAHSTALFVLCYVLCCKVVVR